MIEQEILQLKENLSDFLYRLKDIKIEHYSEITKNSVYLDYKELYAVYSKLTQEEISVNFSSNEVKAINALSLGFENENEFNKLILEFQRTTSSPILNVVDFIKSRNGFDLINKDFDFKSFSDDELVEIFGGLFGVQIAKDCVKSLRAEKVGRVVGYALSDLFNQDILEFKFLKTKDPNIDFCNFLREKIQSSDFECSYVFNENGDDLEIGCNINEFRNASITEVRGRNRVDHCFVNHNDKVITFGQSTSNKDAEPQNYSYFKAYITLANLVKTERINDQPNKYFGYKLRPYLMLGGRFVVENDSLFIVQEKGRDFKKMLSNITKKNLEKLGQMQYFRLFGNAVNSEHAHSLSLFNVFIAGCNTLNLYEFSERMALLTSESEKNKLCFSFVTKYLTDVCEILSKNELSFSTGGKGDLALFIDDIYAISKKIFTNFNFKLSEGEYNEFIHPMYLSIDKLINKIKPITGQFGNEALNNLIDINEKLENIDVYNRKIDRTVCADIKNITWRNQDIKEISLNIDDLSFMPKIIDIIESEIGYQGRKFLGDFGKCLDNKIKYGFSLKGSTFSSKKTHFIKSYGYKTFGKLVDKSAFILDERLTPEKFSEKSSELIGFILKSVIPEYPQVREVISDSFIKKVTSSM